MKDDDRAYYAVLILLGILATLLTAFGSVALLVMEGCLG